MRPLRLPPTLMIRSRTCDCIKGRKGTQFHRFKESGREKDSKRSRRTHWRWFCFHSITVVCEWNNPIEDKKVSGYEITALTCTGRQMCECFLCESVRFFFILALWLQYFTFPLQSSPAFMRTGSDSQSVFSLPTEPAIALPCQSKLFYLKNKNNVQH